MWKKRRFNRRKIGKNENSNYLAFEVVYNYGFICLHITARICTVNNHIAKYFIDLGVQSHYL